MKRIERVTKKGHRYRIEYKRAGLRKWEWSTALHAPSEYSEWKCLGFGSTNAFFPKRKMERILRICSNFNDKH